MKESINNSKSQIRLPLLLCIAVATGILVGANMFGGGQRNQNYHQRLHQNIVIF